MIFSSPRFVYVSSKLAILSLPLLTRWLKMLHSRSNCAHTKNIFDRKSEKESAREEQKGKRDRLKKQAWLVHVHRLHTWRMRYTHILLRLQALALFLFSFAIFLWWFKLKRMWRSMINNDKIIIVIWIKKDKTQTSSYKSHFVFVVVERRILMLVRKNWPQRTATFYVDMRKKFRLHHSKPSHAQAHIQMKYINTSTNRTTPKTEDTHAVMSESPIRCCFPCTLSSSAFDGI